MSLCGLRRAVFEGDCAGVSPGAKLGLNRVQTGSGSRPGPDRVMAERRRFLERVKGDSDAEVLWLQQLVAFVGEHLGPVLPGPAPSVSELSLDLVRILQETSPSGSLPVSYRLVSVSELGSLQSVPCVSRLSWTTDQHRAWVREAEQIPGLRPLPRVKLLLIGQLCMGQGPELMLKDATGELRCQLQGALWSLSPDGVVFMPHWNYIPHDAPGRGLLELVAPPLPFCPVPQRREVEGAGLTAALSVHQAATLLLQHRSRGRGAAGRSHRGGRVSVKGVVSAVLPLLDIGGTTFFILSLKQSSTEVHIIIKDSSGGLWWRTGVHVGMSVHVTGLRACTLRSWSGNSVLSATDQSELSVVPTEQSLPSDAHTGQSQPSDAHTGQSQPSDAHTDQSQPSDAHTGQSQPSDAHTGQSQPSDAHTGQSQPIVEMDQSRLCFEDPDTMDQSEAEVVANQSGLRRCSVISYQGVVTEVLSRGAGLYVMDWEVGLCLANQPPPRRALRPGDALQVSNVHVLRRPSPDHSPIMLCCCLRSSVTVTAFSPGYHGDEEEEHCPGDGVLPRLLLEKDVGVAEYLWMCRVTSQLRERGQQCVCRLSWTILQSLSPEPRRSVRRDIYAEMMDSPHTCRLTQVGGVSSLPHMLSVSCLCSRLLSLCWSTLRLRSLLPPDGESLNCTQLNVALSWSRLCLGSDLQDLDLDLDLDLDFLRGRRPLMVVGLLELPTEGSEAQTLHLRDSTGTFPCVVTESGPCQDQGLDQGPGQDQGPVFNTAWIGCLVCVRRFSMVTERFIQSEFPSFKHLDQEHFISHRDARVYLQFSLDQVTVLSPSVSMTIHQRQGAGPEAEPVSEEAELEETPRKKQKIQDREVGGGAEGGARACVSVVIRVEQKESVARRNVGAGSELSFTLRAAVIGPVVSWGRDPKNCPITEREVSPAETKKVSLWFCGAPCRWFPLLQPGRFYRLVALDAQDPSILIGCAVAGQTGVELHADSTLQVRSDWRIHSVPRPPIAAPESCDLSNLSDVINNRSDLVSFRGLVLDRVGVTDRTQDSAHSGIRLTVCDLSGRSLQVYLDLSHTPFTPGLLPGNTLSFSHVQRRVSRSGGVYCSSVTVSCVSVISVGNSSAPAPPLFPMMLLGQWKEEGGVSVARVKGHLVCVLFLQLQWSCSQCERVFTQSCSGPQCRSSSSVFQAKARAVLEDGSAEAHVTFYNPLVQTLLRLDDSQWVGLQQALRVRGHVQVQPRGRGLSVDSGLDLDPLRTLLLAVCSEAVVGAVSLTCRLQRLPRPTELKRMVRGDREFLTRMPRPLQLTCVHLERH